MALSVETGQFAANTGSATTTVSCGFTGKAIIVWATGQTANGTDAAANASWSIGFGDGTNVRCISWAADDNVATTNCGRWWSNTTALIINSNGTPTSLASITGFTFGASSFDVTWGATPGSAYLVGYMLLGGSDITNVLVGTQTLAAATGAQSVTGLSFQPSFGVFINAQTTASSSGTRALGSVGFAASSSKEFTMAWGIDDGQTMTGTIDAVSYTDQAACMSGITAGAETVDFLADFTSFNSDGYTINVSNAPPAGWLVGYLLIKGGQWDVGTTTLPTAGSTQTISGMAFQPKGLFVGHGASTADATVTTTAAGTASPLSSVGAAISTSTEVRVSATQQDAVLNTVVVRSTSSTDIAASNAVVDFTQFTSDGWQMTDAGNSNALQTGWFAMADNAAPIGSLLFKPNPMMPYLVR